MTRGVRQYGCTIDGSDRKHYSHGWCDKHYARWWRHGDPTFAHHEWGSAQRFLEDVALTYQGTDCLIWPFSIKSKGYGGIRYKGKSCRVPNLVCRIVHGPPPSEIHESAHSCGNGFGGCCNPNHLRWATPKENGEDKVRHGKSTKGRSFKKGSLQ